MSGRIIQTGKKEEATSAQMRPQPGARVSSSFVSQNHPADAPQRILAAPLSSVKAGDILALQRAVGNRAVLRMMQGLALRQTTPISGSAIQAKLMVGAVNDTYEQEADRVAQQVVSMPAPMSEASIQRDDEEELQRKPLVTSGAPVVRRKEREEDEEEIQMKPAHQPAADGSFDVSGDFESRLSSLESGGQRLPDDMRGYMEPRFGADFSKVRIHTDARADQFNQAVLARAFTKGQHIFFRQGAYAPESHGGKSLLAHELTHVLQQSGGSIMAQRRTNSEPSCQCQQKEKELQRSPDLRVSAPAISAMTVIQRDACFIPKQNSPYSHLGQVGGVGPGEAFDYNQRFNILSENFKRHAKKFTFSANADVQQDDHKGNPLLDLKTISDHVAEVDHIVPQTLGGCNHPLNAQVLSINNNASKGDTYPWDKYSGKRVYDPALNIIFNTQVAARTGGADMTDLDNNF